MRLYNVLIFPGGTEIGLEIHRALHLCKDVQLFSAGMDISNHAPFIFKQHFRIPSIHESNWIKTLNSIVHEKDINYIYPAYDEVMFALMKNAESIHTRIVSSPLETCLITISKSRTYRHFNGILPVPKIYENLDYIDNYPVFVKPDIGQGSQGTHIVQNRKELEVVLAKNESAIVLEYLPGDEYTIDCFSDREKGILFCGGRKRIRTKAGISMSSIPVNDERFYHLAECISSRIRLYGAWFFQLKKDRSGDYKLLEIGPRIAGTMALHRMQGINFPLLSIYEQERIPISVDINKFDIQIDRALTNRYHHSISYSTVYVDLDDTLIFRGKINTELVRFLFQCINQGITIKLITKHEGDVNERLCSHRLLEIFDDIIHLKIADRKSAFIYEHDAILIDDSFSERKDVHEVCGIPTFDCSMLELLINERT